jgi:DNA-binding LacI/PurR family transcriptional regulator
MAMWATGVVVTTPRAAAFLSGVCSIAEQQGAGLVLVPGSAPQQRDAAAIGNVAVDGVLAYSLADDDPVLLAVVGRRLPVVVVDQPQLSEVPWVGIDDESAAAAAARHLCNLGHRRLGL